MIGVDVARAVVARVADSIGARDTGAPGAIGAGIAAKPIARPARAGFLGISLRWVVVKLAVVGRERDAVTVQIVEVVLSHHAVAVAVAELVLIVELDVLVPGRHEQGRGRVEGLAHGHRPDEQPGVDPDLGQGECLDRVQGRHHAGAERP